MFSNAKKYNKICYFPLVTCSNTQNILIIKVIDDMEKMRQIITNPRSLQLFIAVDAAKLRQDAYTLIHEKFLPKEKKMEAIER